MTGRHLAVLAIALFGAVGIADGQARGQAATPYPERTVRIVVPFPPAARPTSLRAWWRSA